METKLIGQFIGGEHHVVEGGDSFTTFNPANGQVLAYVQQASKAQIDKAVRQAAQAQRAWASLNPITRTGILLDAANLIARHNEELAQLETADTGKPIHDTAQSISRVAWR